MLILLPPSEGKTRPVDGPPLDLETLSFPELTGPRAEAMAALVQLCRDEPDVAAKVLGLGPTQAGEVAMNAGLREAAAAPARAVYAGVLFDALDLRGLSSAARRRADRSVAITSGLWGLLRPGDMIPAYRLGGGTNLPGVGRLAAFWRPVLRSTMAHAAGDGLVVDLRSGTYTPYWRPGPDVAARLAHVRVLHERDGRRTVVSHHNKVTKGRIARELLTAASSPHEPVGLADLLRSAGWTTEVTAPARRGAATTIDVVVTHVPTAATDAARSR